MIEKLTANPDQKILALPDTNIWVYVHDSDEAEKQEKACQLLSELTKRDRLVTTPQILNELFVTLMRRRQEFDLFQEDAANLVRDVARTYEVLPLTMETTLQALAGVERHTLSFWDALIWATAKLNGVPLIYSEDFQHNREVEGVLFLNPFL